jgi:hypothetical protein
VNLSGNIDSRIGALELSDAVSAMNDGSLETAAGTLYAGPSLENKCPPPLTSPMMCRRIDDAVVEDAAGYSAVGPSSSTAFCGPTKSMLACVPRIDDGALEDAAGAIYAGSTNKPEICSPPTWQMSGCRRIDDSALEASADMAMNPPTNWRNPMGQCV